MPVRLALNTSQYHEFRHWKMTLFLRNLKSLLENCVWCITVVSTCLENVYIGIAVVKKIAWATVSVTNVETHNHICPLTPSNVEVTVMFMDWSAKSNRQKQHWREGGGEEHYLIACMWFLRYSSKVLQLFVTEVVVKTSFIWKLSSG